jgi:pimeloyl-ACP methyl ester carboxylesterase
MHTATDIVLLHGFLESPSMWHDLLTRLDAGGRMIHLPKLPGHDGHPIPDSWEMDAWVDDVKAQLPGDRRMVLAGHSMGGYLLSRFAARHPELVELLVLVHSRAGEDSDEKKNARQRAIEAARENQALYVRGMITGLFHAEHRARLHTAIEEQVACAKALPLAAIEASQTVMRTRPDNTEALHSLSFPVHYYLGRHDEAVKLSDLQEELSIMHRAECHISETAGHMGHLETPEDLAAFMQRIISRSHG